MRAFAPFRVKNVKLVSNRHDAPGIVDQGILRTKIGHTVVILVDQTDYSALPSTLAKRTDLVDSSVDLTGGSDADASHARGYRIGGEKGRFEFFRNAYRGARILLGASGKLLRFGLCHEEGAVHQESMSGKGANIRILAFLGRSLESDRSFLFWHDYGRGGENLVGNRDVMKLRTLCTQSIGGLDYLRARTWFDENEIVHHHVRVIKSQLNVFSWQDVKDFGMEMQPWLDSESDFPCLRMDCKTADGQGEQNELSEFVINKAHGDWFWL
ncbi:MAG: hypothetical protein CMI25_02890 [Opitutae bacterium]|nr:hypothetical protein [Opitutae bacterium]